MIINIYLKIRWSINFSSSGTIPPEFQSEDYIHKVDDTLDMHMITNGTQLKKKL
ncbi:MAG: hypothetical protein CM15mV119_160 [uncultured marine virus]|nr:MAG: hypothetical protein CM15mV119_160 [uncultured marine virus]